MELNDYIAEDLRRCVQSWACLLWKTWWPWDRECCAKRQWRKKEFGKARGLAGRTLGILGFGASGESEAEACSGAGQESRRLVLGA